MSSLPPAEQSVAGGIFNTISKLCSNLGLGISTSVYTSTRARVGGGSTAFKPYLSVYWYAAACAGLSLFLVPFLTLGTQGHESPRPSAESDDLAKSDNAKE